MATRVDQSFGSSAPPDDLLIDRLRSKSPRPQVDLRKIGLKRSNALSDVSDSFKSLSNILDKISITDQSERSLYGRPYSPSDWSITRNFLIDDIDPSFLAPLSGLGGSLTPRLRIEDRIGLVDSFYGRSSFDGNQDGPDAQFYVDRGPKIVGSIRFDFDKETGGISVFELRSPDNLSNITPSELLEGSEKAIFEIDGATLLLEDPGSWSVDEGLQSLSQIKDILGFSGFANTFFELRRQYSVIYPPDWYTESPSNPVEADSLNPLNSFRILTNKSGQIFPLVARSYWFSKSYVESRWSGDISDLSTSIVEDSNMRWLENPPPLKGQQYNWGIRWDGYIKVKPGNFVFTIQTNVQIKIDMDIGLDWVNVFDSATAVSGGNDLFISQTSFDTFGIRGQYRYYTGPGEDEWDAYVPITIRLFRGGPDRADESILVPSTPDLFIKTRSLAGPQTYYNKNYSVSLTGTDGNWLLESEELEEIISILQNTNSSVLYFLTRQGVSVPVSLETDGDSVTSTTTGLSQNQYELEVRPFISGSDVTPLWRSRISPPSPSHKNYSDMTDGSYTPDIRKTSLSLRPDWWKISGGSPYISDDPLGPENTPLDGFLRNSFRDTLQSQAPGLGLYGDGLGNFTERPNLIIGEARYRPEDPLGSNYTGILLQPNRFGEGGKIIVNALPANNSTYSDPLLLGQNDLGGDPNHKTLAFGNLSSYSARLYLWTNSSLPDPENYNKYYTVPDLLSVSESDDPTEYGLPPFSNPAWLSTLTIICVRVADDSEFTTNVSGFVAPLTLTAEKITVGGFDLISFSTTLDSILDGGPERLLFSGKYVEFYSESGLAFQYSLVDTGEGLCFSDLLKFTYYEGSLVPSLSEIPRPPSARVIPFGYEAGGICYPPYFIDDPLLNSIAVDDEELQDSPLGNFDVFWGDHLQEDLGGKKLTITEKIEFSGRNSVYSLTTPVSINPSSYTHRFKIDIPIDPELDEDILEFIGNGEKVKDSYYAYVKL